MKDLKTIVCSLLFISVLSLSAQTSYSVVCEINQKGEVISGSISDLKDYVKNGNPIRVGWVLKFHNPKDGKSMDLEHWTDAGFVSLWNGHVFAQIKSIYQQGPSFESPPSIYLVNEKPDGWVAIIGTTGVMRQKFAQDDRIIESMKTAGMTDKEIEKQMKAMETMKVHTKWAVLK